MGDKMFASFDKFLPMADLCDFTFVVNGKAFKIHRVVFAAQSTYFANIFQTHQKEAIIEDLDDEIFEEIKNHMYTGNIEVSDKNERKLMAAGERFGLKPIIMEVQLHRNLRMDPLKANELEMLKIKYEEAKYIYFRTKDRLSQKNPFSQTPSRYY